MRRLAAVIAASVFVTGLASAQMKVTQTSPQGQSTQLTPAPSPEASLESARRIKQDDAMGLVKKGKAVFVDVRSKDSYATGHIKGAISIPLSEMMQRFREIPAGKMIITYCA